MKNILNRRTIIIFSTALLLAIIAIVSVNVFNTPGPVTGVAYTITRPIRTVASTIAQSFSRIFASMYEYDELLRRNEELQNRIAVMEADYRESQQIAEENAVLRALLGFMERHAEYENEYASFEGWGSDNWSSTFVIDRGYANSTIARGMGVTTEAGILIGQVHEVGATSSTVITVLDTKFSASALISRGEGQVDEAGSSVVAKGDFSYMGSGMLILDQIDDDLLVRRGDMVVTSGRGDVFPSGLIIGEVHDVMRHTSGIGRYALITPLANFNTITTVFVITGFSSDSTAEPME